MLPRAVLCFLRLKKYQQAHSHYNDEELCERLIGKLKHRKLYEHSDSLIEFVKENVEMDYFYSKIGNIYYFRPSIKRLLASKNDNFLSLQWIPDELDGYLKYVA